MIANRPYLYISNDIILCQNFIKVILLKYILNGNGGKELAGVFVCVCVCCQNIECDTFERID